MLRPDLPKLRHYFHLTWSEIEHMPRDELALHVSTARALPPIGVTLMGYREE